MITALIFIVAQFLVIIALSVRIALYRIRDRKAVAMIELLETENIILRSVESDLRKGLKDRV